MNTMNTIKLKILKVFLLRQNIHFYTRVIKNKINLSVLNHKNDCTK